VGSRKPIRYLATILGMTAMASLAAIPLAGVTAGTVAVASTARMTPAVVNGGPLFRHTSSPKQGVFSCQSATANPGCYGPAQIRRAYNIPSNLTGAGKTIVIIDAFGNPAIASDLALFDSTFDLPAAHLNIICITGTCPTFDPNNADQVGWAGEIALDTQWSHADAPGATIDLVISRSDADADILAAQQYVVNHNLGDVLSQSFGEGETCMEPSIFAAQHQVFVKAAAEHMTVFASAGDDGSAQADCNGDGGFFLSASTPASDPLVTGVGGTHLNANFTTGQYRPRACGTTPARPSTSAPAAAGSARSTRGRSSRPSPTTRPPAAFLTSPSTPTSSAACWRPAPSAALVRVSSSSSLAPAPVRRSGPRSRRSPTRRPVTGSAS